MLPYHPSHFAHSHPDKAAVLMAESGEVLTFGHLEARANQGAHLLRLLGLQRGDVVALCLENSPRLFEIVWAAQRAGLYWTCISTRLKSHEIEFIVRDSGAKHVIISASLVDALAEVPGLLNGKAEIFVSGDVHSCLRNFELLRKDLPDTIIRDPSGGIDMLYSSGTTGRPKGVVASLPEGPFDAVTSLMVSIEHRFGFSREGVYLSPAPLYHAAPLRWAMNVQRLGGTVVVMERFDAERALALIETHRVSCAQFVPTHFIRMLKLNQDKRGRYDVSSLASVVHAAAPCPIHVKEQMISWWGPIIHEYYAGTEGNGMTYINSNDWLTHKGSVGKAVVGVLHICDDAGDPVPPRIEGLVTFEGGHSFSYRNDWQKTQDSRNKHGWTTLGDIGWIDEEGYLYLTDRKSFMIISGGVNIYPQEIENALIGHADIADIAVVGAPDPDLGEIAVAVIQPEVWENAGSDLSERILEYARTQLATYKLPRRIEFMVELPRHPTGKLYKRLIRDRMWAEVTVHSSD